MLRELDCALFCCRPDVCAAAELEIATPIANDNGKADQFDATKRCMSSPPESADVVTLTNAKKRYISYRLVYSPSTIDGRCCHPVSTVFNAGDEAVRWRRIHFQIDGFASDVCAQQAGNGGFDTLNGPQEISVYFRFVALERDEPKNKQSLLQSVGSSKVDKPPTRSEKALRIAFVTDLVPQQRKRCVVNCGSAN